VESRAVSRISTGRSDLRERIENMLRCLLPALAATEVIDTLEFPGNHGAKEVPGDDAEGAAP